MNEFQDLPETLTSSSPSLNVSNPSSREASGFRLSGVTQARVMAPQQLIYPVNVHTSSRMPIKSGVRRGEKPGPDTWEMIPG